MNNTPIKVIFTDKINSNGVMFDESIDLNIITDTSNLGIVTFDTDEDYYEAVQYLEESGVEIVGVDD